MGFDRRLVRIATLALVALVAPLAARGTAAAAAGPKPLEAAPGGNSPPRAIAGPDQKIGTQNPAIGVHVTLDGSASFDPDGDFITYAWSDAPNHVLGTSPALALTLYTAGSFHYALTVCDTHPACASAAVTVEVVWDFTPPSVDAPDLTIGVSGAGGTRGSDGGSDAGKLSAYLSGSSGPSAVDDIDPQPQFLGVEANGAVADDSTLFPTGFTPVTVRYRDQAGNIGSAPATVRVVDLQDSDLFVQAGEGNCFQTPCYDAIERIRGSSVTHYCSLAGGSSFNALDGLIVDSYGRVISLRNAGNIDGSSGLELVRCNAPNAPPERFAWIRGYGPLPAGYGEPFPTLMADNGSGFHLARLREVVIDDNQNHGDPFIVNEDAYVFDISVPGPGGDTNKTVMYHVKQDFWEDGPQLGPTLGLSSTPAMYFYSGTTYATGGGCLDRVKIPLNIHASGQIGGVDFDLRLGLFGSSAEICGWVLDNVSGPHATGCNGQPLPGDGSGWAVMDGFYDLTYDDHYGLTLFSNSGATGSGGILTHFSELPFDDPGNPGNFFPNTFMGCAPTHKVSYDAMPTPSGAGWWGTAAVASTPSGMFGTAHYSGTVFNMSPGSAAIVASGLEYPSGITAWPPNVSAGGTLSVVIRIDSPVDVMVTDSSGKRLGVKEGAPVNDFNGDGYDSGPGTHPRFLAIQNPAPGDFKVDSVGTGDGPYTVHVYSIDPAKPFGSHILSSGIASPGSLGKHNFTLGAAGGVKFTNHPPAAVAGPDRTVYAAGGTATFVLDGSGSSDPDGDALSYTWAGPFGLITGANPQVTLPLGVSVLSLTVDDGKGGVTSANVTITVDPCGDAVLGCDDANPCTDDACDVNVGCVHAANTASCDDGDACTTNDACSAGVCAGTRVASPPGPPALDAAGGSPVTITWSAVPGEHYNVYRGVRRPGRAWAYNLECAASDNATGTFLDPLPAPMQATLFYAVTRFDACGESSALTDSTGQEVFVPTAQRCPSPGPDSDADGSTDALDNCPQIFNPGQADQDGDGVGDLCDNCPAVANPDQKDTNQNGLGDACDP